MQDQHDQRYLARGNGSSGAASHAAIESRRAQPISDLFAHSEPAEPDDRPERLISAMWRNRRLMVMVAAAIVIVGVPAVWLMVRPEYSSTAMIRVAAVVPRLLYKTEDNGTMPLYSAYLNTQVSVIQCPEVLTRALTRPEVRESRWYREAGGSSEPASPAMVDRLGRQLWVEPQKGTELIDVTFSSGDPREASSIVNAIVQEYESSWNEGQNAAEEQRLSTLRTQLGDVQRDINELFDNKFALAEQLGTNLSQEVRTQLATRLNDMKVELAKLRADQALRKIEKAHEDKNHSRAKGPVDVAAYPTDALWLQQRAALEDARKSLMMARMSYGEAHPLLQAAVDAEARASDAMRMTEARLAGVRTGYGYEQLEHREDQLQMAIDELMKESASVDPLAQQLAKTEERYSEQKTARRDLMDRLAALETERNAPARVAIQSLGTVRLSPSSDRRVLFSAMMMFMAVGAGIGAGYLRARIDTRIHELGDLSPSLTQSVPFLGQLPRATDSLHLAEKSLLGAAIGENVRMVRTMLLHRLKGGGVVVVTSPEASAGKTTMSILLARSLAQMGKRVLLVDADLPRPMVTRHFGLGRSAGLRALLNGEADDKAAIVSTPHRGLDVLPVGSTDEFRNKEMLAGDVFPSAIERWRCDYDIVLIDSPPVLAMADARIAAAHADGTVMVLKANQSTRHDAVEAFGVLSAAGARLLGSVLVGVDGGSAYYSYRYYESTPPYVMSPA